MRPFNAGGLEEALAEIAARRRLLNNFKAAATIELTTPTRKLHINADITVEQGDHWRIKLNGPLGVDLALIEIGHGHYSLKDLHNGQTYQGYLTESFSLSDPEIELPSWELFVALLLPCPDIAYPQDWAIQSNPSLPPLSIEGGEMSPRPPPSTEGGEMSLRPPPSTEGEEMSLVNGGDRDVDGMRLKLRLAPLRVLQEIGWVEGERAYVRDYVYGNRKAVLPSAIDITIGDLKLHIKYDSLKLCLYSTPRLLRAPL